MLSYRLLDQSLIESVAELARQSPRLRQNHNFHALPDGVQRFLNGLQPGTYVRPHRHHRPASGNGFEFFLVLQGELGLLILDEQGRILDQHRIQSSGAIRGIELAEGTIHTLVALQPDTVIFELKEGPYIPSSDKDFLVGFPLEGSEAAALLVQEWQQRFDGSE